MIIHPIRHVLDRKNNNQGYSPRNCKWSTPEEQARNRRRRKPNATSFSKVKGVYWQRDTRKWYVQIRVNSKTKNLGTFVDKEKAEATYKKAESFYFGGKNGY